MEIILAMTLSFVLGAYIRKPFRFCAKPNAPGGEAKPGELANNESEKVARQLKNLLNYGSDEC